MQRVLQTALLYFVIVFAAGILVSVLRVEWVTPVFGATLSLMVWAIVLVAAVILGAVWAPQRTKLPPSPGALLGVGFGALFLQQCADVILSGGVNWSDPRMRVVYFHSPAGLVYLGMLALFAFAPILVWVARGVLGTAPNFPGSKNKTG